jgi:membrane protein
MADEPVIPKKPGGIVGWVVGVVDWVMRLKPVRVIVHFNDHRGPLLAMGLSNQAIFAVFAAIWVAASTFGLVLQANEELRDALFNLISAYVPGLIDTGEGGAIDPDDLVSAEVLTWTGALALIGLIFSIIGWFGNSRNAVRIMADLPGPRTNWILLMVKDFFLALAFAVALIVSAGLSLAGTTFIENVLDYLGVDSDSTTAIVVGRSFAIVLMFALDTIVLAALYRVLAGVRIPPRQLFPAALIGAAALGVLKILGTTLLGAAGANPLLASFAVIIGLLIWFNLVCQVILIAAAWFIVSMIDAGIPLDEVAAKERRKNEAEERAALKAQLLAELEQQKPKGLARVFPWLRRRPKERASNSEKSESVARK